MARIQDEQLVQSLSPSAAHPVLSDNPVQGTPSLLLAGSLRVSAPSTLLC
jgi:hypothetical protein